MGQVVVKIKLLVIDTNEIGFVEYQIRHLKNVKSLLLFAEEFCSLTFSAFLVYVIVWVYAQIGNISFTHYKRKYCVILTHSSHIYWVCLTDIKYPQAELKTYMEGTYTFWKFILKLFYNNWCNFNNIWNIFIKIIYQIILYTQN